MPILLKTKTNFLFLINLLFGLSLLFWVYAVFKFQVNTSSNSFLIIATVVAIILALSSVYYSSFLVNKFQIVHVEKVKTSDQIIESISVDNTSDNTLKNISISLKQLGESKANLNIFSDACLKILSKYLEIGQGVIYLKEELDGKVILRSVGSYATLIEIGKNNCFELGEGLIGMSAKEERRLILNNLPKGYLSIFSGTGGSAPKSVIIQPIINNSHELKGVLELASFQDFDENKLSIIDEFIIEFAKQIDNKK